MRSWGAACRPGWRSRDLEGVLKEETLTTSVGEVRVATCASPASPDMGTSGW